jgi:hypothetical protein
MRAADETCRDNDDLPGISAQAASTLNILVQVPDLEQPVHCCIHQTDSSSVNAT